MNLPCASPILVLHSFESASKASSFNGVASGTAAGGWGAGGVATAEAFVAATAVGASAAQHKSGRQPSTITSQTFSRKYLPIMREKIAMKVPIRKRILVKNLKDFCN